MSEHKHHLGAGQQATGQAQERVEAGSGAGHQASGAGRRMPRYQSHKRVWALKIAAVDGHRIIPAEAGFAPVDCPADMFARGTPEPGDYLVEYEGDGYRSFSPAKAFEEGYRPMSALTFGDALDALKVGKRAARAGWNGKGMNLELQVPDTHSKMTLPYIFMKTVQGDLVPWLASQTDMLADDWEIVSG